MKKLIHLFVMAILVSGCTKAQTAAPAMPKIQTDKGKDCGSYCQANHSQCIQGCRSIGGAIDAFGARAECFNNCNQKLSECYSNCEGGPIMRSLLKDNPL
jgi:hypothetical protein